MMKGALAIFLLVGLAVYAAEGSPRKTLASSPTPSPAGRTSTPTPQGKPQATKPTLPGPPRPAKSKTSSSGARSQASQYMTCRQVDTNDYCEYAEQFYCCDSMTGTRFSGCDVWDNNQQCDYHAVPACCW